MGLIKCRQTEIIICFFLVSPRYLLFCNNFIYQLKQQFILQWYRYGIISMKSNKTCIFSRFLVCLKTKLNMDKLLKDSNSDCLMPVNRSDNAGRYAFFLYILIKSGILILAISSRYLI